MILVDSSVWIEYFNGRRNAHTDYLDNILGVEPVGLGDIILTEVLQGFRFDSHYQTAKSILLELPVYDIVGSSLALKAASNYRFLRKEELPYVRRLTR